MLGASAGLLTVVDCQRRTIQHHTPTWVSEGKSWLWQSLCCGKCCTLKCLPVTIVKIVQYDCYAAGREPPYAILLAFSGMRAALAAGSAFNDRVAECHEAAAQLLAHLGRSGEPHLLGQLSHEEYGAHKAVLGADSYLPVHANHESALGP